MSSHCLRCKKECEEYWFTFGLPGAYCAECVEFVVNEHEYLSDLIDKVLINLKEEFIKKRLQSNKTTLDAVNETKTTKLQEFKTTAKLMEDLHGE